MNRSIFDWFTEGQLRQAAYVPIRTHNGLEESRERCFICEEPVKGSHYRFVSSGTFKTGAWVCMDCWFDVDMELHRRQRGKLVAKRFLDPVESADDREVNKGWRKVREE